MLVVPLFVLGMVYYASAAGLDPMMQRNCWVMAPHDRITQGAFLLVLLFFESICKHLTPACQMLRG